MCNFLFIAFRLSQLCETELVPRLRCSFIVLGPGLPVMLILWLLWLFPTQPPNWAWETSRQNWTAYPAERRTQTCPTPTRRLPPKARIHEGIAVRPPFFFSHPPPPHTPLTSVILHVPCPSTLHPPLSTSTPPQRSRERKRDMGGGAGVVTQFCLPIIPELTASTLTPHFRPPPSPPFA